MRHIDIDEEKGERLRRYNLDKDSCDNDGHNGDRDCLNGDKQ